MKKLRNSWSNCDNHYAVGWAMAMNTPYQWSKMIASHWGGTRNGTVGHWPQGIEAKGEVRSQFTHVTDLHAHDSILMLAGVLPKVVDQLEKTGLIRLIGRDNIFVQGEIIGQSVLAAWDKAEQWIADEPLRRAAQMAAAESEVQEEETTVYLEDNEQLSKLIRKDEKTTRAGDEDV